MANTILLKRSSTTTNVPTAGELSQGELAINTADERLFSKNSSNVVFEITDHDNLTNYVANEHIDWTNATQNLVTTGTLSASGNTIINSKINGQTILTIGESSTLRGDGQDAVLRLYSENAGVINQASFANTGSNLQLSGNVNFQVNMGIDILAGEFSRQRNTANTAWVNHIVSTTPDLNTTFDGGSVDIVDWNISGLTGVVNLSNPLVMGDNDIRTPVLEDYGITHQVATVSANAVTVNCTLGNSVYIDMDPATAAVTLTLSNPPASGTYGEVNLLIQMGTPAYGITWPGSVTWMGGGAPSLTTVNDDYDLVHLFTVNGGTTWFGTYATSTATGGGNVSNTGTPLNNQVAVWTSSAVIEGDANLTFSGTQLAVTGTVDCDGILFGATVAASAVDLTKHISLYSTTYGVNVTAGSMNFVTNGSNHFSVTSSTVESKSNHNFAAGIDVTGNITVTGTVDGKDVSTLTSNTGTVTSVAAGNGMSFTTITGSGSVTMGTPGTLTAATTNAVTATSHTHDISTSGSGSILASSGATLTGQLNASDQLFIRPEIKDYSITSGSATISANAATLTYSTAQAWELDLEAATGNVTVTLSGGPPASTYGEMIVKVQQDTTAARTITWAGGTFEWPGGTAPTMTATADAIDIYHFSTWNGGTNWWGSVIQDVK